MIRILPLLCIALPLTAQGWQQYGGDAGGQRFVADSAIGPDNVATLAPAWVFRTGDATPPDHEGRASSFRATPILTAGRLVVSSGFNRVFAVDPVSGKQLWVFDPEVDLDRDYSEKYTSRGVSAWTDDRAATDSVCRVRILLGTLDARLIAIDAGTGQRCRSFGRSGDIDLSRGIRNYRRGEYSLTSPVTVAGDVIVVGSSIGDNGAVELEPGTVRAFDARSGELLWRWDPVPGSVDAPGGDSWGKNGGRGTGGANVWSIASADVGRGLVFLPTTSPAPDFFGGLRPGRNRFANSVVALHAQTGKPVWDFQLVHHDLWDSDLAAQPLLVDLRRNGKTIPAVVQATKMGHVFVIHRETGVPLFPVEQRAVPESNVQGEAAWPTQPFPVKPPPLHDQSVKVWPFSPEHARFCERLLEGVRYEGIFTPPAVGGSLLFPGNGGGTNWGGMAVDPRSNIAVLAVSRLPTVVELLPRAEFERRSSNRTNDLVDIQYTGQRGTPYGMARFTLYNPESGLPCLEGPWGEVIAMDLDRGTVRWRAPLGVFPGTGDHPDASEWGSLALGGPMITAGEGGNGLVFMAPRFGLELLAWDLRDGRVAWRGKLPAMATATPMGYRADGADYVVIAAGGDVLGGQPAGDYLVAFRRPIPERAD